MHYEVAKTAQRDYDFRVVRDDRPRGAERPLARVDVDALSADLRSRGLDDRAIADILSCHLADFAPADQN
uniref:Uncharacterized protein n=2 Tax=cellular organisms TaxID=131567 RepID=A0A914YHN6_9BILA